MPLIAASGSVAVKGGAMRRAVVASVLESHHRALPYKRGSWGPKAADALIAPYWPWHNPVLDGSESQETAL